MPRTHRNAVAHAYLQAMAWMRQALEPRRRAVAFRWWMAVAALAGGCRVPDPTPAMPLSDVTTVPPHFPEAVFPDEPPLTRAGWELGRHLFFDTRLSVDGSIRCASCHAPALSFSDSVAFSRGADNAVGFRNAPVLVNLAWQPRFHREAGIPSLEAQVLAPLQDPLEFNHDIQSVEEVLQTDATYQAWSEEGFGRPLDAYVVTRALAMFERTLISGNAPYDRWLQGDATAMSEAALRGLALFEERQCIGCHSGLWFTDFEPHNNGLHETYVDPGTYRLTFDSADIGAFKTPTLRNLAWTAPYMVDGSLATLSDVVAHYNAGGAGHPNQDPRVAPLGLSDLEKADLEAFLLALSDSSYVAWAQTLVPN